MKQSISEITGNQGAASQEGQKEGKRPEKAQQQHKEGAVAKSIEQRTAELPSDLFLWSAVGAIGVSLGFQIAGKRETSNFIGQWAPTLLILGLYNKVVKLLGSDGGEAR